MSLTARERTVFACLADTVLAPVPPLPAVRDTDAVASFDALLECAPRPNRVALRAVLLALGAIRWPERSPTVRLRQIERVRRHPLIEAIKSTAALSYYGDPHVQRLLGYDP